MSKADLGKTRSGMQPNAAGLLCYLFGFMSGIIFYLTEKENKFVRFHAMQSIVVFGFLFVLSLAMAFMPLINLLAPLMHLIWVVLWILLMVKSYQGEYFKIPIAGDIAEKNS